jgi:hypothetical protein
VLLTHNREQYVRPALRSLLRQDCPPAEILISDDASTDDTWAIIEDELRGYTGPHTVKPGRHTARRGERNMWETCAAASGDYIVVFHDDDVAAPERASRLLEVFERTGAAVVSTNARLMDAAGADYGVLLADEPSGWLTPEEIVAEWNRKQLGATQAYARAVFHDFPPWSPGFAWGAFDHILPFRGALLGGCYFLDETLVHWRQHGTTMSKDILGFGASSEAARETNAARFAIARHAMLADLEAHIDRRPDRAAALDPLRSTVTHAVMARIAEWSERRNTLLNAGQRPNWVPVEGLTYSAAELKKGIAADRSGTAVGRARALAARGLRRLARWVQ